jgi:hypothetical protein
MSEIGYELPSADATNHVWFDFNNGRETNDVCFRG